jgi:hypothetical protein
MTHSTSEANAPNDIRPVARGRYRRGIPLKVKAFRIDRFGVEGIVLRSSDAPRPGLREVLMWVRASSLNYTKLP